MILEEKDYLAHFGTLRKSGRYPWGSGEDEPETLKNKNFLEYVSMLRKQGLSDTEIAKGMGISRNDLQAFKSIARNEQKASQTAEAVRLKNKGYSNGAIAEKMGLPGESSVRSLLKASEERKIDILQTTSAMLKDQVDKNQYVDIGKGVENHLGITKDKLATAVALLKEQGYVVENIQVDQLGTTNKTLVKVLAVPGTTYRDIVMNKDKIRMINETSKDGGLNYLGLLPPIAVSQSRIGIKYNEDGGADADGVIYVRPGAEGLSLGGKRYAQVRIAVEGDRYLKGMAIYKDDLPDGIDLQFNTNKTNTGNKLDAMKKYSDDPENPFGSIVRQLTKTDSDGNEQLTSAINIVNDEGQWEDWNRTLSSQMLSKQKPTTAKGQLDVTFEQRNTQLAQIMSLTNPTVRRMLLEDFADATDSSAVHLKAAAMPRQKTQVIMPVNSLKDNEVYAPNFKPGETVALIRYPHGGTFEIPELTVNNSNRAAKKLLGQSEDAIGINSKVAQRLSGADFDGDTVLVIPNNKGLITSTPALQGLKDFDPKTLYPKYEGMPKMSEKTKQVQMGLVSNLITDMTIGGAPPSEIVRAIRHSMVVIDAEKHDLNYKQSAIDNNIKQLKKKYQTPTGGAATLISRKKLTMVVPERKLIYKVDPVTGKKIPIETGKSYVNKEGKTVVLTSKVNRLAETDDAHTMASNTNIEKIYADHSNKLKALANTARLESINTPPLKQSASAKKVYANEVSELNAALNVALKNAPLERRAQLFANATLQAKRDANPNMEKAEIKKLKFLALAEARRRFDAGKTKIEITPKQWDAIQSGAISNSKLSEILRNSNMETVKMLAAPKIELKMTGAKQRRAQSMMASGYSQAEVADALGVSLTTLTTTLKEG